MFGYRCEECSDGIVRATVVHNFRTKFENVPFVVPEATIGVCDKCGAREFSAKEHERWEKLYQAWREEQGDLISAAQIRQLREDVGMTESDFAALIGATRNALHHWESPDREVPQSRLEDNLLRLLRESCDHRNVDAIETLLRRARDAGIELSPSAAGAPQVASVPESGPKVR